VDLPGPRAPLTHPPAEAAAPTPRSRAALAGVGAGVCLLVLAACSGGGVGIGSPTASAGRSSSSASPSDPAAYAAELVALTGSVRAERGLAGLAASACATSAAVGRAGALSGGKPLVHAPLAGVIADCAPASVAAENLSRAAASPADVMAAWMASPGHRSNLLDPTLTELGVGCVPDGAQMLCSQIYLGP